jgi:hypothetical protein
MDMDVSDGTGGGEKGYYQYRDKIIDDLTIVYGFSRV